VGLGTGSDQGERSSGTPHFGKGAQAKSTAAREPPHGRHGAVNVGKGLRGQQGGEMRVLRDLTIRRRQGNAGQVATQRGETDDEIASWGL